MIEFYCEYFSGFLVMLLNFGIVDLIFKFMTDGLYFLLFGAQLNFLTTKNFTKSPPILINFRLMPR